MGEVVDFICIAMNARPHAGPVIDVIFLTAYIVQLLGLMILFRSQTVTCHQFGWFDAGRSRSWSAQWCGARCTRRSSETASFPARLADTLRRRGARCRDGRDGVAAGDQRAWSTPSFNLLLVALLLQLITDSVAALWSGYTPASRLDTLWTVGIRADGRH